MANRNRYPAWRLVLATALLSLAPQVQPAAAATFTVNSVADINDLTPGNGLCVAYLIVFPPYVLPFCTLRAAVEEANALPGPDRIILPAGTYPLSLAGSNEDGAASGDLDITDALVLSGAGTHETFIDGDGLDRVLDLFGGESGMTTIAGLTIRNGNLPANLPENEAGGAGIRNGTALTLRDVRLQGNRVNGAAATDAGGGLLNTASCVAENTTLDQNRAAVGGGIATLTGATLELRASTLNGNRAGRGAGLFNAGSVVAANSTVSGNRAEERPAACGGGILNQGGMKIVQGTVASNLATGSGGGLCNEGSLSLVNTLLAGNTGGNCGLARALTSLGHNLDSGRTCNLGAAGDLSNADPKLDNLALHGGATATHGLLLGSPAVDQGLDLSGAGITTDQRGIPRPQGRAYDIGAFETGPRSLVPLLVPLLLPGD